MRPLIALALTALAALAGCTTVETNDALAEGKMAIEPHPTAPGARRVMFLTFPDGAPIMILDWRREADRRESIAVALGEECRHAPLVEEARMPFGRDAFFNIRRERVYYRLEC